MHNYFKYSSIFKDWYISGTYEYHKQMYIIYANYAFIFACTMYYVRSVYTSFSSMNSSEYLLLVLTLDFARESLDRNQKKSFMCNIKLFKFMYVTIGLSLASVALRCSATCVFTSFRSL